MSECLEVALCLLSSSIFNQSKSEEDMMLGVTC